MQLIHQVDVEEATSTEVLMRIDAVESKMINATKIPDCIVCKGRHKFAVCPMLINTQQPVRTLLIGLMSNVNRYHKNLEKENANNLSIGEKFNEVTKNLAKANKKIHLLNSDISMMQPKNNDGDTIKSEEDFQCS